MEIWKQVPGWPRYEVSSEGRVRNVESGKVLLQQKAPHGYMYLALYQNSKSRPTTVHALVAEAFIGPRPYKWTVNHKNGVKHDNRPENLEYVTYSANHTHAYRQLGRYRMSGEKNPNAKISAQQVVEIRSSNETQERLATLYGLSARQISAIRLRKKWKHVP